MNKPDHRRYRSKQRNRPLSTKSEPWSLKLHRSLRPVLKRIGTPEPAPFVPDPFQVEALETLARSDVLVTAPTGSGKTYIAVEALEAVLKRGGKSWYASPLKALSNAKYEEFRELFGAENVGILTGDRKENIHAPVIVGTTEILRNQLYDIMHRGEDLDIDLVVLDEAHFLGDPDRGVVWEEVLIYLPARVRLLLLSATIRNAEEICGWLTWMRGAQCEWVSALERPVPLFPLFLFPGGELAPLGNRRGLLPKIADIDVKSLPRSEIPEIPKILDVLRKANLLPAIFFLKSRSDCDKAVAFCQAGSQGAASSGASRQETGDGQEGPTAFQKRLAGVLAKFPFLRSHQHLSILKSCRVGSHHGGQLPHWKLLLEKMMQEGYLEAIFSTSTIAAGVNFPARTAVIFQSDRFNGREFVPLSATDLLQMTGRAGRRGMDEIGFAMVVPGQHQDPQLILDLLKSPPDQIQSQIRVNFSMVLNLLLSHTSEEIRNLFVSSLATFQNMSQDTRAMKKLEAARTELEGAWREDMACGSLEALYDVRPQYMAAVEQFRKMKKSLKRRPRYRQLLDRLAPGRVFLSNRGTPYLCIAWPDMEYRNIEAARLGHPLRFRRGRIRVHRVAFQRIRQLSDMLDQVPEMDDREAWQQLAARAAEGGFAPVVDQHSEQEDHAARDLTALGERIHSLPCGKCTLFGPCHKDSSHPFATALRRYFHHYAQVDSTQEELWRSFLKHYRLLRDEGYVSEDGKLTADGMWASKLRLDQPLLISEGIRKGVFPQDSPEMLAAVMAPFVMDRDRQGDVQLASLIWKYPDLARPFFKMLKELQRLRQMLQAEGFEVPPLPFWAMVMVYHWAKGLSWEEVREISGMDEGDQAMIILRTADHLRQLESLAETHPRLAATAGEAIRMLLREPVLAG